MNLTTLSVQQTRTNYEKIAPQDIEYLYDAVVNNQLDNKSKLVGNVEADYGYRSHCQAIQSKFKLWNYYIKDTYYEWEDLAFQRAISKLHGDGTGIRPADLIKTITLTSVAAFGNTTKPFWQNKDIRVIDMRPFENFRYTRTTDSASNLCVVKCGDNESSYNLKEIYYTSTLANGLTPLTFIEAGPSTAEIYMLDKVWYEGPFSTSLGMEQVYGGAANESRVGIKHFYWLNHSEGLGGYSHRNEIRSVDGTKTYYYIYSQGGWNSRGSFFENMILDSPIPIYLGAHTWGNGRWRNTMLWVPDDQLEAYNLIYSTNEPGEMPASISTMSVYNNTYRSMANWWVYPGRVTYQVTY